MKRLILRKRKKISNRARRETGLNRRLGEMSEKKLTGPGPRIAGSAGPRALGSPTEAHAVTYMLSAA